MRTAALIALLLIAIACNDTAKQAPAPDAKKTTADTKTSTPPKVTKPTKASTPGTTPRLAPRVQEQAKKGKTIAKTFRTHLKEGRELVRAKKYKEGIVKFEEALKLDPNHARGLSELGWAAFNAGDLDRAETANLASVRFARDNTSIRGASLYNLGRIEEQRGNMKAAVTYYERSVKARPNKTVAARLKTLTDKGFVVRKTLEGACDFVPITKGKLLDVAQAYSKKKGYELRLNTTMESEGILKEIKVSGSKLTSAAVFGARDMKEDTTYVHMAMEYDGSWHVFPIFEEFNPGAFGILEEFKLITLEAKQMIPGGEPEVLIKLTHSRTDTDMGLDEFEAEDLEATHIFGIHNNKPSALLYVETVKNYVRDQMGQPDSSDIASELKTPGLPIRKKSGLHASFDTTKGTVTLSQRKKMTPTYMVGTYPIATFPQRCAN